MPGSVDYKGLYEQMQHEKAALEAERAAWIIERDGLLAERAELVFELDKLRRRLFGMNSDTRVKKAVEGQLDLFTLEAPEAVVEKAAEQLKKELERQRTVPEHKPRSGKRLVLPDHLERREVVILPKDDLSAYKEISRDDVTEVLVIEPLKMWVKRIIRPRYALKDSMDITRKGILQAPAPSRTVQRGLFDESVLAFLLVCKFIYHLPLYRIRQMFSREGIQVSASMLSHNVSAAISSLKPIYNALKTEVLGSRYLQIDETTYKVLRSGKKGSCHTGYMWVYHSPPTGLLFFEYRQGRGHEHPKKTLKDFRGVAQTDGYEAYETALQGNGQVTHIYCLSHMRRKYDEAAGNDLPRASHALKEMGEIYKIEDRIRQASPALAEEQIVEIRRREVIPIMDRIKQWMLREYPAVLPKSPIGKAIAYALQRWDAMYAYTLHGHLQVDNNSTENAIRPLALGRRNHLFAGTHETAQDAAIIYSLFATCKKQGIDPQKWIADVLLQINDPEEELKYRNLMPHRWKPISKPEQS
ncbi:Transposase [bacterium A37T11]|nr:Transposase [bacterium A37T11]